MLDLKRVLGAVPKTTDEKPRTLLTPWGEEVAAAAAKDGNYVPRAEHPHPQFARAGYRSLNGWWQCAFAPLAYDPKADAQAAVAGATGPARIETPILVPFSPEAPLSTANRQLQPGEALWYSRVFPRPQVEAGQRVLLHFEAVDDTCAVWVNDVLLGTHQGGYLPFCFDITDALQRGPAAAFSIRICVVDPSDAGIQLRGKQRLQRGNIWYTAQSGIWQPVWLETVPEARVEALHVEPDPQTGMVRLTAKTVGRGVLTASVFAPQVGAAEGALTTGEVVATGSVMVFAGDAELTLVVPRVALWSPEQPALYGLQLRFGVGEDAAADVVDSYFAFRSVTVQPDAAGVTRLHLNGVPRFQKGLLNQGYWPDGILTAPADAALVYDITAMQRAGFTMMREHIKVEADRFYYHCDRLGMMVWQDMVTGGAEYSPLLTMYLPTLSTRSWTHKDDTSASVQQQLGAGDARYRDLWRAYMAATIDHLRNHPSIITWVLFNEGWGQFDSAAAAAQARRLDSARAIHAVSGWYDQGAGDFFGVHNYFRPQTVFADEAKRPKGTAARACVTCEFGGLVYNEPGHAQLSTSFGYDVYNTRDAYRTALRALLAQMDGLEAQGLAGYVYTQVSDVEEETNGILTYDRKVNKLD